MQVVGIKIAFLAAMLTFVLYNSNSPVEVMDKYFGIPKENIQFQQSFVSNNGDSASYEVVFAYTRNLTQSGTNFFNEVYIIPEYLSSKKGEEAYRVSNIVLIKEVSWMQTIGFIAHGIRKDSQGFLTSDEALIVPDDQTFAFNVLRTLANDPKSPFGLKCINSKRFFEDSNIKFLSRSDMKSYKVHYLSEKYKKS